MLYGIVEHCIIGSQASVNMLRVIYVYCKKFRYQNTQAEVSEHFHIHVTMYSIFTYSSFVCSIRLFVDVSIVFLMVL